MSQPDLAALPRLPRDADGPVFAEPWQAQVFALALDLHAPLHLPSATTRTILKFSHTVVLYTEQRPIATIRTAMLILLREYGVMDLLLAT